jgi:aryl-alcohol dehydrogenase-like predicted oxidoreductase
MSLNPNTTTIPTVQNPNTRVGEMTAQTQQQQRVLVSGGNVPITSNQVIIEPTIDLFNRFVAKDTHCLLGKTGMKLSRLTLGTMNFGKLDTNIGERPGQLSENDAHKLLDRFVKLGGNCIDTADFFPWFGTDVGKTELMIGNWLSKLKNRESVFLITKCRMPNDISNINSIGLSRSHLIDSVNQSLKRLQTDHIDMLVLNGWDQSVSFHETVRHLDELVRHNKIRYIGVCDLKAWQLQKLIDTTKLVKKF